MLERTQIRLLPITNRAADHAPMVTACCNACRMCAANNILGLGAAGGVAVLAFARRFARRFV
jgi:hypothetical protein